MAADGGKEQSKSDGHVYFHPENGAVGAASKLCLVATVDEEVTANWSGGLRWWSVAKPNKAKTNRQNVTNFLLFGRRKFDVDLVMHCVILTGLGVDETRKLYLMTAFVKRRHTTTFFRVMPALYDETTT